MPAAPVDLESSARRDPGLEPGETVALVAGRRGFERQLVLRGAPAGAELDAVEPQRAAVDLASADDDT